MLGVRHRPSTAASGVPDVEPARYTDLSDNRREAPGPARAGGLSRSARPNLRSRIGG